MFNREKILKFYFYTICFGDKVNVAHIPEGNHHWTLHLDRHTLMPTGKYRIKLDKHGNDILEIESYIEWVKMVETKVIVEEPSYYTTGILWWKKRKVKMWRREEIKDVPTTITETIWVDSDKILDIYEYEEQEEIFGCGKDQ